MNPVSKHIIDTLNTGGNRVAVVTGDEHITYRQLNALSSQIADGLSHRLKPGNNIRIGVSIGKNRYLAPAVAALFRMGITYVPIDPSIPKERIRFIVDDCEMQAILTTTDLLSHFEGCNAIDVCQLLRFDDDSVRQVPEPSDNETAYIIYTSGTTGRPKGVPISYSALSAFLQSVGPKALNFIHPESRILQFTSIGFDVSIIEIIGAFYYGATQVIVPEDIRLNTARLYELMRKERVTFASFTSSYLATMPSMDFPDMEVLCSAGEPMIPSVARQGARQPYRFVDAYGPTESTVYCISREVDEQSDFHLIGKPFPGVTIYVVDADMNLLPNGETGEMLIGGRQLTQGYLHRQELNEKLFVSNTFEPDNTTCPVLYRSGDLVRRHEDGQVEYVGRKGSQVKLRGFRIELGEIRSQIEQNEQVVQAFVRLEELGKSKHIAAYIMPKDPQRIDLESIKLSLRAFLPVYMIPTFWTIVPAFKRNVNGKIDQSMLHNPHIDQLVHNASPLTQEESMLAAIVSRIVGVDDINVEADLIDELGFSSLQMMNAIDDLNFTGMYISTKDFYEYRTIRRIVAEHQSAPCYWYRPPVKGRPTLLVISGYTSFMFLFPPLVNSICDTYNVFVIESYFEMGVGHVANVDELVEKYVGMVEPVISQYGLDVITGFCLGGELGLYMAHRLHQLKGIKPHVVVMDGEVKRDKDRRKQVEPTFTDFTPEINAYRFDQEMVIIETMPDFRYDGPVTSILAKQYSDRLSFNETDPISDEQKYWARTFFDRAPAYWKQEYPDCELLFVDCDHLDYLRDERSIKPIADHLLSLV